MNYEETPYFIFQYIKLKCLLKKSFVYCTAAVFFSGINYVYYYKKLMIYLIKVMRFWTEIEIPN